MEKDVFVNKAVRNIPVHNIFPQRANFVINSVNGMNPKKLLGVGGVNRRSSRNHNKGFFQASAGTSKFSSGRTACKLRLTFPYHFRNWQ
jgi:hypothetical protein